MINIEYFKDGEVREPLLYDPESEDFEEIILQAYDDFRFFIRAILGCSTPDFYNEWIKIAVDEREACILASRGLGKSFFFSYLYPLWRIFRGDLEEIVMIGDVPTEASRRSDMLRQTIEENPWLQHLQGSYKSWAKESFRTSNGVSVTIYGLRAAKRGRHPQLVILDDILTTESTLSMEAVKTIYNEVIANYSELNTQTIVVGTPFSADDLYSQFEEREVVKVYRYPVINSKGESIWKERKPITWLNLQRKKIGEDTFAKEYLLEPVSAKTAVFKEKALDAAFKTTFRLDEGLFKDDEVLVISCDFAFSDASGADYTVLTVVGRSGNKYFIRDAWRQQGTTIGGIVNKLDEFLTKYPRVKAIVAEDNGQQIAVVKEIRNVFNHKVLIVPYTTTKYNKNSFISTLSLIFEHHNITVPANKLYPKTKKYSEALRKELKGFVNREGVYKSVERHDDCVMSLSFGVHYLFTRFNVFIKSEDLYDSSAYIEVSRSLEHERKLDLLKGSVQTTEWKDGDEDRYFKTKEGFGW